MSVVSVVVVVVVLKCSSQASLKEQHGCSMLIGASFNSIATSHDLFGSALAGGHSDTPATSQKYHQVKTTLGTVTKFYKEKCEGNKNLSASA